MESGTKRGLKSELGYFADCWQYAYPRASESYNSDHRSSSKEEKDRKNFGEGDH